MFACELRSCYDSMHELGLFCHITSLVPRSRMKVLTSAAVPLAWKASVWTYYWFGYSQKCGGLSACHGFGSEARYEKRMLNYPFKGT